MQNTMNYIYRFAWYGTLNPRRLTVAVVTGLLVLANFTSLAVSGFIPYLLSETTSNYPTAPNMNPQP